MSNSETTNTLVTIWYAEAKICVAPRSRDTRFDCQCHFISLKKYSMQNTIEKANERKKTHKPILNVPLHLSLHRYN